MNAQLSNKDWQLLSAYLDGQINEDERTRLEMRLSKQPELKAALEDLRRTQAVLRAAPRRKVPHNFTLTHAMVAEQRSARSRWFPALTFSSAIAAVLLVITLLLPQLTPNVAMRSEAPAAQMDLYAAPEAAASEAQGTPTAPIIIWGGQVDGRGGGGGGGDAQFNVYADPGTLKAPEEAPPAEMPALPEEMGEAQTAEDSATEKIAPTEPLGTEVPPETLDEPGPTPFPTATLEPEQALIAPTQEAPVLTAAPVEGAGPIVGIAPDAEQGNLVVPTTAAREFQTTQADQDAAAQPASLTWIQLLLGFVTLGSGAAAFALWRRNR